MVSISKIFSSGLLHSILLGVVLGFCVMIYFNTEENRKLTLQQNLAYIIRDPVPKDLPNMCKSVSNELKKIQGDVIREQVELKEIQQFMVRVKSMTELHEDDLKKIEEGVLKLLGDTSQIVTCNVQSELAKLYGEESPIGSYPLNHQVVGRFFELPEEVLAFRKEAQLKILKQMHDQYSSEYATMMGDYCTRNDIFSCEDTFMLYLHIRMTKPKIVIQIQAEHSILVVHRALSKNRDEDQIPFRLIQISPKSRPNFPEIEYLSKSLTEIPMDLFQSLAKNDLLFIEGSHVTKKYGETVFEYVFLLPQLQDGVFVHFHKIFLPDDYPVDWMSTQDKQYTEQWLLAMFLYRNDVWRIYLANYFLLQQPETRDLNIPTHDSLKKFPSSMYIQKIPSTRKN